MRSWSENYRRYAMPGEPNKPAPAPGPQQPKEAAAKPVAKPPAPTPVAKPAANPPAPVTPAAAPAQPVDMTPHARKAATTMLHTMGHAAKAHIAALIDDYRTRAATDPKAARLLQAAEHIRHHMDPGEDDFAAVQKHIGTFPSKLVAKAGLGSSQGKPGQSVLGPDNRVPAKPHPEIPAGRMTLPRNREIETGRIPRDYQLVVPMDEAMATVEKSLRKQMASQPDDDEDNQRINANLDELRTAHAAGDEKAFARTLAGSVNADLFGKLAINAGFRRREVRDDAGSRVERVGPTSTEPRRTLPEPKYGPRGDNDNGDLLAHLNEVLREPPDESEPWVKDALLKSKFKNGVPDFFENAKQHTAIKGLDWLKNNPKAIERLSHHPELKGLAAQIDALSARSHDDDRRLTASRSGEPLRYGIEDAPTKRDPVHPPMPKLVHELSSSKMPTKPAAKPTGINLPQSTQLAVSPAARSAIKPPLHRHVEDAHAAHGDGVHAKLEAARSHFADLAAKGDHDAGRAMLAAEAMIQHHGDLVSSKRATSIEAQPPVSIGDVSTEKPAPKPPVIKTPKIRSSLYNPRGVHADPERGVDDWWHNTPEVGPLRTLNEKSRKPLGTGISGGHLVTLAGWQPGSEIRGIWKTVDSDKTAEARHGMIPDGNHHGHESAAWETAKILGMGDLVPPTVSRSIHGQVGSLQHFRDDQEPAVFSPNPYGSEDGRELIRAAALDALILNTDRHTSNWLVDPNTEKMSLIDNSYSFPVYKDRNVLGDFAILARAARKNLPVPHEVVKWDGQWPHIERSLRRNGLSDDQIESTKHRFDTLVDSAKRGDTFMQWLASSGLVHKIDLG